MQKEIAIIIPCYNEEERLPVKEIEKFLKESCKVKLFLVDDGSNDNTSELLRSIESNYPEDAYAIINTCNRGKAEAIRLAVNQIVHNEQFRYIGFFDADLSTPLYEIKNFLQSFTDNPDLVVVMGSRIKRLGASITRSWRRHVLGRVFASAVSKILQMPVYDTQCGAKIFRSDIVGKVFANQFISKWLFDVEVLGRIIIELGYEKALKAIYESPLSYWADDGNSRIKMKDIFNIPWELLKIQREYYRRINQSKKKHHGKEKE
ncbi:MAG: glycosyltransferase [Bacteroidota bacterium]